MVQVSSGLTTPSSRAVAKVTTLPTLPGSKTAWTLRAVRFSSEVAEGSEGSTELESARTTTLPVAGSMAMTMPQSACWAATVLSMVSWAMDCRSGLRVVRTVAPGLAGSSSCSPVGMMTPLRPTSSLPLPSVPVKTLFWVSSSPAAPMSSRLCSPSWVKPRTLPATVPAG